MTRSRRRLTWRSRRTVRTAVVAAAAVIAAGLPGDAAFAQLRRSAPSVQRTPSVPGREAGVEPAPRDHTAEQAARPTPATTWPEPGFAVAELPARGAARAGALPVRVAAARRGDRPARVTVELLPREAAEHAGVTGLLVRVRRADRGTVPAPVTVTVDYSSFANVIGGDWASRLRLVGADGQPLPTANDFPRRTLTATVEAAPDPAATSADALLEPDAAPSSDSMGTFAVAAAASGGAGDYGATSLGPSAAWQVNTQTGDFSWSYPFRVPPGVNGPVPALSLAYSSGSVDGRTASTNAQPSWIGEGHSLEAGYIERKYVSCADDMGNGALNTTKTGDLCWRTDNANVVLAGHSGELVQDPANPNLWRLEDDDATKIERLTGAGNGDNDGEYWKLTTTDGTQYYFGLLKRYATDTANTGSTFRVPVFGNHTGEPCKTTTWATSYCVQAWRWNLAYVVDPHGNTKTYFYTQELNRYGRNNNTANSAYHRGGYLTRIEYGERAGNEDLTAAPAQVDFTVKERCVTATTSTFNCESTTPTATNASNWPDVPVDQICADTDTSPGCPVSPTFFTRKRLTQVQTKYLNGTTPTAVDTWALAHTFPDPGDGTSKALWLESIQHTGNVGTAISLPKVTFIGNQMQNRVDGLDTAPMLNKYRVSAITSETGAVTSVNYYSQECSPTSLPASPHTNTMRCFPVYFTPDGATTPTMHYFHKYVVRSVVDDDQTAVSADKVATYTYLDSPAWHYDDNELSPPKYRTYSDYRGYGKVRVTLGLGAEQSVSETTYLRGMDGDRLPNGVFRDVSVPHTQNGSVEDHPRLKGVVLEERTLDGTAEVSGAVYTPWVSTSLTNGAAKAYLSGVARADTRVALANGGYRRSASTKTFDEYGMVTEVNDLGDTAVTTDDLCTRTTYVRNTALWILDSVSRTETVSKPCSATPSRPADVVGDVRTYYDGATSLTTAPTRGLPTKTEVLDAWTTGPVYKQQARVVYDANGRTKETYDATNVRTALFEYTPATTGPVTQMKETNAAGHVNTTTLHPAWGATTAEVDANTRRTDLTYDALGRLTQVWAPGRAMGTNPTSPHMRFSYLVRNNGPVVVTTDELRNDGTYTTSHALYDGLLRPRQTQAPAPGGGRTLTDTVYDSRGLVSVRNGPYFNSGALSTSLLVVADAEMPSQVRTTYDATNRPVVSAFHVLGVEKWRTTTTYAGDRVHVDPPDGGTPTTTITDGRERVVALREYHGSAPTGTAFDETTYEYYPGGQPKAIHDAAGNSWSYTYDLRGREVSASDPDRGSTTTAYNDLDQVTSVTDSRNKTLAYLYDNLGRRTETHEGSATGPLLAKWVYDGITTAKGKASSVSRFYGNAEYKTTIDSYDLAYRPTSSTLTIPETDLTPLGLAGSYTTTMSYNTDGGVKTVHPPVTPGLPDETLTIGYDALGLADSLVGFDSYIADTTYSSFGEVLQMKLGTTVGKSSWQTFEFEQGTRRLVRARVDRENAGSADMDVHYTYDASGNVKKIADVPAFGTQNETQCFSYDYLQRLTDAWTANDDCAGGPSAAAVAGSSPAPYWHTYGYDVTGNRRTEILHDPAGDTTRTYDYPAPGGVRPHAVSSVTTAPPAPTAPTTQSFDYDAAGNTTVRGGDSLTWDAEGRVESVTTAQGQTRFLYDANGTRLVRKDPGGTTLYLDGTEVRLDATGVNSTRYYTHLGRTVAVRTGGNVESLFSDHQGTPVHAVHNGTMAVSRRRFTPFGAPRGTATGTWVGERSFLGATADSSTALVHLGAREYDPLLGRFMSVDPVLMPGNPQQLNAYAYAGNSPITSSDPSGLVETDNDTGGGTKTTSSGGSSTSTSQTQKPKTPHTNEARETILDEQPPLTAGEKADIAVNAARQRQNEAKEKVKNAIGALIKLAADELGITAAVNCFTQGDMGACGEMALNIVMSVAGGIAGKMLAKYGMPWKWKKAVKLVGRVWDIAGEAIGALRGLFRVQDELRSAVRHADEVAKYGDDVVSKVDNVAEMSCPVGNSFTAETPVVLADGSTKPIGQVRVGDLVTATDPLTGLTDVRPVTALIVHGGAHTMVDVTLSDGTVIHATDHHPFWVAQKQAYVHAVNLRAGSKLRTTDGGHLTITGTRVYDADVTAHNLTVAGLHTYYAGPTPVLVHNCGPVGRRGSPIEVRPGTNKPTSIGGRDYSGHALDRMQGRGIMPSVVDDVITNGTATASRGNTTVHSLNGVRVVVNQTGKVVTVIG